MGKGMTAKEELLREIESATDGLLVEVLSFLQGLKTRWTESKNTMIQSNQLQQDIAALPESAQVLVAEFVTFLKHRYTTSTTHPLPQHPKARTPGLHQGIGYWMSDDFDAPLPDEFWLGEDV